MTGEYIINTYGEKTILRGEMRLKSPVSYEKHLQPVKDSLNEGDHTLDVTELEFLNSSGVSAIARLCLLARDRKNVLTIIMNKNIPWQEKTFQSLLELTRHSTHFKVEEG